MIGDALSVVGAATSTPQPLTPTPLLSLCMIARDNERTIGPALEVIRNYVDDIVVVDTGSKDRTPEIAASLGARLFHFEWCDDFSAARNESIRHALGQWIFWMDTDDVIDDENARKVREIVSHDVPPNVMGFLMKVRCPGTAENGNADYVEVDQVKLFRNVPEHQFEWRIHEQILAAIRRAGGKVEWTDVFVTHANADQSPEGRARKQERDLRILELENRERPDHPFTLFNLGMTYADAGRHEEAVGHLWQSIGRAGDEDSHLRKCYALLVVSYRQLGRHTTALETCNKGLKHYPCDVELRFRQASLLHHFGQLPETARAYEELLALPETRHLSSVDRGLKGYRARHNLADVYAALGDLAKAEALFRHVIEEAPHFQPARLGLGKVLLRQNKTDEVLEFADGIQSNNGSREARLLRADAHLARGDKSRARDELDAAIRVAPDDIELLERRCRLMFEHFQPAEAEPAFRELLARVPDDAAGHHNFGSILYKLGRFDEAASSYRRSLAIRPESASTYLHLGFALRESSERDEALAALREADRLAPNDPTILEALHGLRSQ